VGRCSFCALSLHQGERIVSRSEESILEEIRRMTKRSEWKGFIDDLGGPTANMYGLDGATVEAAHRRLIGLMRAARKVPGVKKVFVRSGIRYDLAIESPEYVRELVRHHVSGLLKIAPEHVSESVLKLMNKSGSRRRLDEFRKLFADATGAKAGTAAGRRGRPQHLKYYFMVAHPGTTDKEARELAEYVGSLERSGEKPVEGVQIFTPTPMTRSTCMYHTGKDPVGVDDDGPVRHPRLERRVRIDGSLPLERRVINEHAVDRARGDAEEEPRPAELEEVLLPLPVRTLDDADLVTFRVEHTGDHPDRRQRMVGIRLPADQDDVEARALRRDHRPYSTKSGTQYPFTHFVRLDSAAMDGELKRGIGIVSPI
jgi:radical SAM superfamily enzyme YgiQ (UPF0313 family)